MPDTRSGSTPTLEKQHKPRVDPYPPRSCPRVLLGLGTGAHLQINDSCDEIGWKLTGSRSGRKGARSLSRAGPCPLRAKTRHTCITLSTYHLATGENQSCGLRLPDTHDDGRETLQTQKQGGRLVQLTAYLATTTQLIEQLVLCGCLRPLTHLGVILSVPGVHSNLLQV